MSDDALQFNPTANIYISYASSEQALLDELLKHLAALPWDNIAIYSYHQGQISELRQREEIESRINAADVVVIIVSSSYLDSVDRRRWELDEIAGKSVVIAINLSPVSLKASQLQRICSAWLDYSSVTSRSGQLEKLKIAAATIYEKVSFLNLLHPEAGEVLDDIKTIGESYSSRGVEVEAGVKYGKHVNVNIAKSSLSVEESQRLQHSATEYSEPFFKEQLGQVYRISEISQQPTKTNKDLVDCSVFSPPAVACGDIFLVQVFVHLPEQAEIAKQQAQEFDSDAKQLGVRSLGIPLERGTELTFYLSIPKLEVDEPIQQLNWQGRAESVQFGVTVPDDLSQKTVIGTITVSQNSIPLGHLKFKLSIISTASTAKEPQPLGDAARIYKKAFVSYSSKDRKEVLKRVQGLAVTGIEVFQDILNLEPGDRWGKELYRNIDECDLFLLFWSTAAKESEWVLKEALYALERQGKDGLNPPEIIPVIIEGLPPVSPPNQLQHLHFNDKLLYLIALSNSRVGTCLMSMTIADLEQLQAEHPDWQMELVEGNILVMGPSDYESEEIGSRLLTFLNNWVMPRRLGRVTGSSAGFILPSIEENGSKNGEEQPRNLRDPDVSFVRADKLKKTKRDFVELLPDLTVEVKSKTDRIKPLVEKIELFLKLGTQVGILIDPDKLTLAVYRLNQPAVVLKDGDTLTIPELLPGWELAVSELWPPEFD
ncbi:Uma2 family endonuclease [Lyngbya aestuarii]|uniref:Uma2 family endonuclease n=1 Tax=Lyngbya aestuarii TaxID=118322 RepID=UPI00403D9BD6